MTDAPERIWAFLPDIFDNMSVWQDQPSPDGVAVEYLRADHALAAREERDKRVRDEALREAAAAIKEHTDTARKTMRMVYAAPVWSAIISHLGVEHDRILALIEGDQTDDG